MEEQDVRDHEADGVDRRGFLKCMAWAGTGLLWTAGGGVLSSRAFGQGAGQAEAGSFSFVQISDSHIGFGKDPYKKSVTATLQEAVARINALPQRPDFLIHTGDLTHLATPEEFDTVSEILKEVKVGKIFYVPGEHDVIGDGSEYLKRFGEGTKGEGWYSFDHHGVHFIGLVNVASQGTDKGLGVLGNEQLAWLKADVAGLTASTPVVVFGHVPLWAVYPQWGWGTQDGQQALSYLKRFGSVTVLNGHIHQIVAEGRREHDLPHRALDRLPPAGARSGARPGSAQERARREVAHDARPDERELRRESGAARRRRLGAPVNRLVIPMKSSRGGML